LQNFVVLASHTACFHGDLTIKDVALHTQALLHFSQNLQNFWHIN